MLRQRKNSNYPIAKTSNSTTTNQHKPFSNSFNMNLRDTLQYTQWQASKAVEYLNVSLYECTHIFFFHKLSSLKFLSVPFRLTTRFHKTQKLLLHYLQRPLTEISSGKTVVQFVDLRGLFYLWVSLNSVQDPCFTAGIATAAYHIISCGLLLHVIHMCKY